MKTIFERSTKTLVLPEETELDGLTEELGLTDLSLLTDFSRNIMSRNGSFPK